MRLLTLQPLLALLIGTALLFTAGSAFAQETAQVQVDVIVANTEGSRIDPALDAHAKQLRAQFKQFTNFTRADTHTVALKENAPQRIDLPGDGHASITLKGMDGAQYILHLKVPGGHTTVKARARGMLFIGGPKAPNGTILLLIQIK